jgi:hypothetical protein
MYLHDLLREKGIETQSDVLVMRHTPKEPDLNRNLPSLAETRPDLFNAYQSTQGNKTKEDQLKKAKYLASFIGHERHKAIFVGLFKVGEGWKLDFVNYWRDSAHLELKRYGMKGFTGKRKAVLKFPLDEMKAFQDWKGKLIIDWPGSHLAWSRWMKDNKFSVCALLEESKLAKAMPDWTEIVWRYDELKKLPQSWEDRMSQWRGIYFIFDRGCNKGYVGSAYGAENIIGRWRQYGKTGHGGNKYLRKCKSENLRFSILEIDSHIRPPAEIIEKESSWKARLHTRYPQGLNGN